MNAMVRFKTAVGMWVVAVDNVVGVRPSSVVRSLPSPARGVAGVLDHDGRAVPVLSTLGVGRRHVLILEWGTTVAGLLVDEVTGVVQVGADDIGPAPSGQQAALVEGTVQEGTELAYVLDVGQVLNTAQSHMEKVS